MKTPRGIETWLYAVLVAAAVISLALVLEAPSNMIATDVVYQGF
jgi:hypothetical protein